MPSEPDYSRAGLARFIEYVVAKGLVNPSTAQGWRVATSKVLEELTPEEMADVRRIDVEAVFRSFLNRYPGRLSPASVGEYRRRVGRAIEEFVIWMENPAAYGNRAAAWAARSEKSRAKGRAAPAAGAPVEPARVWTPPGEALALGYPLRPGFLAQVVVPPDLTVDEARRMGAFLLTLAPDFRPA